MTIRRHAIMLSLLLLTGLSAQPANGATFLDDYVTALADKVGAVCKEDGYESISIKFEEPKTSRPGDTFIPFGSGPQMWETRLGEELKTKHGLRVSRLGRASIRIVGQLVVDLFDQVNGRPNRIALDVRIKFVGPDNTAVSTLRSPIEVETPGTIALILGLPFDGTQNPQSDQDPAVSGLLNPNQVASRDQRNPSRNQIVRAAPGSLYGMQLLKGGSVAGSGLSGGQPVDIDFEDGLAVGLLDRSSDFSVKLYNDAKFEVGVQLTLDGIDSFHFTRSRSFWLIAPGQSLTINGWQLDNARARRFTIVPYAESLAVQLNQVDAVGVIQACFSRTYRPDETLPPGEEVGVSFDKNGVGLGKHIESPIRQVGRKVSRHVSASVAIRYQRP